MNSFFLQKAFSLVEVVVAIGVFAVFASVLFVMSMNGYLVLGQSKKNLQAVSLINESFEALEIIRASRWNEIAAGEYALLQSQGYWQLGSGIDEENINGIFRSITVNRVYRDEDFNYHVTQLPGTELDPLSKNINISVVYSNDKKQKIISKDSLISAWNVKQLVQGDWSGGDGQIEMGVSNKYLVADLVDDDSGISLFQVATSTFSESAYLESSSFYIEDLMSWTAVLFVSSEVDDCDLCDTRLYIKTANDENAKVGDWSDTWCGPDGEDSDLDDYFEANKKIIISSDHNSDKWIKYRVELDGDSIRSPEISEIKILYQ